MNRLTREFAVFKSCPLNMRVLVLTNLIYALVMPVIEIFIGAYVMMGINVPPGKALDFEFRKHHHWLTRR